MVELQRQDTDSSLREVCKNIEEMDQSFRSALEAKLPSVVEKKLKVSKTLWNNNLERKSKVISAIHCARSSQLQ